MPTYSIVCKRKHAVYTSGGRTVNHTYSNDIIAEGFETRELALAWLMRNHEMCGVKDPDACTIAETS